MAKRKAKQKTQAEIDAVEADRMAAHNSTPENEAYVRGQREVVQDEVLAHEIPSTQPRMDEAVTEYMNSPLHAEVTEEQDAAIKAAEEAALAEVEEEAKLPNSVVAEKFKLKYIEQAKANGHAGKAAKRSSWDWLAQEIASECLKEKEKIDIQEFMDLLELNDVDYSRWTNRNKGWEGRFRMTGRVALQKVVANSGKLKKKMSECIPPAAWVERFKTKA